MGKGYDREQQSDSLSRTTHDMSNMKHCPTHFDEPKAKAQRQETCLRSLSSWKNEDRNLGLLPAPTTRQLPRESGIQLAIA